MIFKERKPFLSLFTVSGLILIFGRFNVTLRAFVIDNILFRRLTLR